MKWAILGALATLGAAPMSAPTYVVSQIKPHDPALARCKVEQFVDALNSRDFSRMANIKVIDNSVGQVNSGNAKRFFESFDLGDKMSPNDPLKLGYFSVLKVNEAYPLYVITLERRIVTGRPATDRYWAAWLLEFESNEVRSARRTDELWPFARTDAFASPSCEVVRG